MTQNLAMPGRPAEFFKVHLHSISPKSNWANSRKPKGNRTAYLH
jgi:hypothetical protein